MGSRTKNIIVGVSISVFVAFAIISGIVATIILKIKHHEEIDRIITEKNGVVLHIDKVSQDKSPFLESTTGNIIYKITYEIEGKDQTAWYRGVKTVNNIHKPGPKTKPEAWIFE
ncbi:hypothetical protein ACX93W_14385 [Paenibacillus sp. CAU 1782]